MTAISDIVDSVHPADEATGVPLNNTIQITFDREIDEWSLEHGGIVVEGPDTDLVIYPGYTPTTLVQGSESEILESPGLQGLVPGQFIFQRVDLTTTSLVNTSDTTGDGTLYRTKVLFKPSQQLKPQTNYTVYITGDDDTENEEIYGIRSRTIFDTVTNVSNTGTGSVTFSGTYLGELSQDTLNIRITTSGVVGEAEFEAWRDSQPLDLIGPFKTSLSECQVLDGITVQFIEGTFLEDDEFSVVCKRPSIYTGTLKFSFTTGNGSITAVPTTTATSVTGDPVSSSSSTVFEVIKTTPKDGGSNLVLEDTRRIIIEFNSDIDPDTITEDSVQISVEPVIDHPLLSNIIKAGPISHTLTVSGSKLYIDL